jgi:hypothetical protein
LIHFCFDFRLQHCDASTATHLQRAQAHFELLSGNQAQAVQQLQTALQTQPSNRVLWQVGLIYSDDFIVSSCVHGMFLDLIFQECSELHLALGELPSALACLATSDALSAQSPTPAADRFHLALWQARLAQFTQRPKLFAFAVQLASDLRPDSIVALTLQGGLQ